MQLFYGVPEDIEDWMELVNQISWNFPGLETQEKLDIARCLYTLHTGKIIAKTAAADWALENNLCPVPDVLKTALKVRKVPLEYKNNEQALDYAETLADSIQSFADVLENALKE